jgi:hypothetical protein
VAVHPIEFGLVTRDREVREYLEAWVRAAVSRRLAELGVDEPRVKVERRGGLSRSAGGKLQMVIADPASRHLNVGPG